MFRFQQPGYAFAPRLLPAVVLLVAGATSDVQAANPAQTFRDALKIVQELEAARREEADKELKAIGEQLERLESRASYLRKWTRTQFELDQRGLITHPEAVPRYLQRLQKQRETALFRLLQFRDQARGAIRSGAALNFFVDACGPVAFEISEVRRLEGNAEAKRRNERIERELLSVLSTNYMIGDEIVRHIRYSRGLVGAHQTGRLSEDPLDLVRLESALRSDEFQTEVRILRDWRDVALKELRDGKPVSAATAARLIDSVKTLLIAVRAKKKEIARSIGSQFEDFRPYLDAERHMLSVSRGAARLIEAHEIDDITFARFTGGNIQELLAYMYHCNLHFDGADKNGENAYRMLFELAARYYLDLRIVQRAAAEAENGLTALKRREQELTAIKLGGRLDVAREIGLAEEGFDAIKRDP
ncbi:MAG TPA: hypothetical protein PK867_06315 [Pirellulales bacterium]|nr:hypothetical protein [Pirellulales bacterium]